MAQTASNSEPKSNEPSAEKTQAKVESKIPGRALILPGAVAKGAYEAGVISVIAEMGIQIDRLIATSSGSLNAVAFAAGIRIGKEKIAAKNLIDAWVEFGSWHDSFHFNPLHWFSGKGLSDQSGLLKLLHELVPPAGDKGVNDFELRIIVASLDGIQGRIGDIPSTTHEKVLEFCGKDFDTKEGLEKVFQATVAACSFPGLFAPAEIEGLGLCLDGGAVNNAPVQYALDDGDINEIIIAVPFPILVPPQGAQSGLDLINHAVEILINERLYRDLKNAENTNKKVDQMNALVDAGVLSLDQLRAIKKVLPYRKVRIIQVRPEKTITGGVFTGFVDQGLREKFIAEGREAALKCIPQSLGDASA